MKKCALLLLLGLLALSARAQSIGQVCIPGPIPPTLASDNLGNLYLCFVTTNPLRGTWALIGPGTGAGANTGLSNLGSTSVNVSLLPGMAVSIDLGSISLPWRLIYAKRYIASGTPLTSGDFALSPGWGNSASVSNITGTDEGFNVNVTSNGTGQSQNPILTLTYHDGAWQNAPIYVCAQTGGIGVVADVTFSNGFPTTTTLPMIYNSTPVTGFTYIFSCIGLGR